MPRTPHRPCRLRRSRRTRPIPTPYAAAAPLDELLEIAEAVPTSERPAASRSDRSPRRACLQDLVSSNCLAYFHSSAPWTRPGLVTLRVRIRLMFCQAAIDSRSVCRRRQEPSTRIALSSRWAEHRGRSDAGRGGCYFTRIGRLVTTNSTSSATRAMVWLRRPAASRNWRAGASSGTMPRPTSLVTSTTGLRWRASASGKPDASSTSRARRASCCTATASGSRPVARRRRRSRPAPRRARSAFPA